jgi:hypothetical protein
MMLLNPSAMDSSGTMKSMMGFAWILEMGDEVKDWWWHQYFLY